MKKLKVRVLAWMALGLAPPLWALSLRTPGKKIVIEELQVGHAYSLAKKARDPAITNTGTEPIDVRLQVERPNQSQLEDGYESPPRGLWLRLKNAEIGLSPGKTKALEGMIIIPDKSSLKGGQYQIDWTGEADNKNGSRLKFSSHLLLDISSEKQSQLKMMEGPEDAHLSFALSPPQANARDVPLGRAVNLKDASGVSLKIINPNDFKANFALRVKKHTSRILRTKAGFARAPNPHFLKLRNTEMKVGAGKIGVEELQVDIPDESRYRERKWFFILSVTMIKGKKFRKKDWIIYIRTKREVKK